MKYWLFRIALAVVPRLPQRLVQRVGLAVGWVLWATLPGPRRRVTANLAHVPALAANSQRLRRAARQVFGNSILNYIDFFRLPSVSAGELAEYWTVSGVEQVDAALAEGRGCILICSHLGNFDYALRHFLNLGYKLTVTQEHLKPERLHQLVMQVRNLPGLHFAPVDSTSGLRALLTALRRNEIVLMPADRDIQGHGEAVTFFGEPAPLPTGGIQLAQRTGAALLGVFPHRQGLAHGLGEFVPLPALNDEEHAAEPDPTRRSLRQVAKLLEQHITRSPEQWVIFAPVWPEDQPTPAAGLAAEEAAARPAASDQLAAQTETRFSTGARSAGALLDERLP
jgi:KDO2-lipid IV(A) lauroyltransferase